MVFEFMALFALGVWSYVVIGRGGFWRCAERDAGNPCLPMVCPRLGVAFPAFIFFPQVLYPSMRGRGALWNGRFQAVRAK
jgi:hypothetical protein